MRQGIIIGKKIMGQGITSKNRIWKKDDGFIALHSVIEKQNFYATGYTFGPFFMRQGAGC